MPTEYSRIVFMGTAEFGIRSLNILHSNDYPIVAVVTNPDKPAGRGRHLSPSPIKESALSKNLLVLQPQSLKEEIFSSQMKDLRPDIIVVVAFRILPEEIYTLARLGAFNLHASLLPRFRGAAPIQRAIMNGEPETGVTTFFLRRAVDTGSIIMQARCPISENETAGELYDRLSEIGAEIVLHTVRLIEQGKANPKPQNDSESTPAPKITKEDCAIPWHRSSSEVHNLIRALSPVPGAFTFHKGCVLKIFRSRIVSGVTESAAGVIIAADNQLIVGTGHGAIELIEIQQEGKKKMPVSDFLHGYDLKPGDILSSVQK